MVGNHAMYQHAIMLMDAAKERLIRYTELTDDSVGKRNRNKSNESNVDEYDQATLDEEE